MKYVIYKEFGEYNITTEENYNARIQDSNKVQSCKDFTNAKEIIECFVKYCGKNVEDFIVIE